LKSFKPSNALVGHRWPNINNTFGSLLLKYSINSFLKKYIGRYHKLVS
jgi:hypothetical protein